MFMIQIVVESPDGQIGWWDCHPAGGAEPYKYATLEEADSVRRICYGDPEHAGKSRVIEYTSDYWRVVTPDALIVGGGSISTIK
jgi:hypothetical protein